MSDINYKVRYVNQYDQIVREVPKTGILGDTVSITPNQLGYGFETIVADPKSLELVEDESLNIVEFRVMQTLNNLTVGNHYLDKRLSRTEIKINGYDTRLDKIDMLIDKNQIVDPDTVLWEGARPASGSSDPVILAEVLDPKLSNFSGGLEIEVSIAMAWGGSDGYPGHKQIPWDLWNVSGSVRIPRSSMLAGSTLRKTPTIMTDHSKSYRFLEGQTLPTFSVSASFGSRNWSLSIGTSVGEVDSKYMYYYKSEASVRTLTIAYYWVTRVTTY